MTESLTWWIVQFALSLMDFVMMYFISHAMMKRYVKVEKFHIGLAVLYTVLVAPTFYFFDGHIFRFASVISHLIAIKIIIKRTKIPDLIMILVMSLLITSVIQIPIAGGVWLANQTLDVYMPFAFLIGQALTATVITILCQKLHWYKWFDALQANIGLKMGTCLLGLIVLIPMAIINFEYQLSYFLLLTLIFVLASFVLLPTFMDLSRQAVDNISNKKLKNHLFGLWLDIAEEQDVDVVKAEFKANASELGVALPPLDETIN